jgi:Leucine-rich repeat (LRR) protein
VVLAALSITQHQIFALDEVKCRNNNGQCKLINCVIDSPDTVITVSSPETITEVMIKSEDVFFVPDKMGETFPNLYKKISITDGYIDKVKKSSFEKLRRLKVLQVRHCHVKEIEAGAFDSLTSLKSLYLDSNDLESLPPKVFSKLKKLKLLTIHTNRLQFLDENLLDKNSLLASVYLVNNPFVYIPQIFGKRIAFADLRNCTCIDGSFSSVKQVASLRNQLKTKCSSKEVKSLAMNINGLKDQISYLKSENRELKTNMTKVQKNLALFLQRIGQ